MPKDYDYLLKVLLVGDSDVGKHEIMAGLEDASSESPFCSRSGNCECQTFSNSIAEWQRSVWTAYTIHTPLSLSHPIWKSKFERK